MNWILNTILDNSLMSSNLRAEISFIEMMKTHDWKLEPSWEAKKKHRDGLNSARKTPQEWVPQRIYRCAVCEELVLFTYNNPNNKKFCASSEIQGFVTTCSFIKRASLTYLRSAAKGQLGEVLYEKYRCQEFMMEKALK